MYAVIETGGKQYRVEIGTELEVELLQSGPGETVAFDRILLVADGDTAAIGTPVVANASVAAEVVRRDRGEKLISFKYRPKARRRVKKGHRQELTVIRISDIVLDGRSAAKEVAKAEEDRKTERQRLEEAARRQAEQDAALAAKLAADKPAADKPAKGATKAEAKSATKAEAKSATTAESKPSTKRASSKAADTTEGEDEKSTARKTTNTKSDAPSKARARKSDED
jgi:large subunit ribosomal protein L21